VRTPRSTGCSPHPCLCDGGVSKIILCPKAIVNAHDFDRWLPIQYLRHAETFEELKDNLME
jgi:hypothetical protein